MLGLTFKPNTDDMREAPSLAIIQALQDDGAQVRIYDPEGMKHAGAVLEDVVLTQSPYECAEGAEALVIVTEWNMFRALDFERLRGIMAAAVLVDLRNIYRREEVARYGFAYSCVGRPGEEIQTGSRAVSRRPELKIGNRWGGAVRPPYSLRYRILPSN